MTQTADLPGIRSLDGLDGAPVQVGTVSWPWGSAALPIYAPPPATITIPAGQVNAILNLGIYDDATAEAEERLVITVLPRQGYRIGTAGSSAIAIQDNEKPTLRLDLLRGSAPEGGAEPVAIRLTRLGDERVALTARLAYAGTATMGTDFPGAETALPLGLNRLPRVVGATPPDPSQADILLHALDDDLVE